MKNLLVIISATVISLSAYSQKNMSQLGHLPYSKELSDVWGYVDEAGNEYALVGVYDGLSIVDVSDPSNPEEVFFGTGPESIWRDIKTWGDYAYVSNETGGGVYIVDLSPLPDGDISITANYTGNNFNFSTIHNLFIDEFGKLYIFGSNNGSGGAIICDLTQDPMNPVELGRFNDYYLHDGMARGDTLWGAAIYQGVLSAINVSDPANPFVMGTVSTPSQFTHNAWVSDDGTHVYTTDEVSSGFLGAYNVTDPANMYETDRIRSATGTDVIPHNVHVYNDFLITSYYTDGITIHDAKYPDKLIEVGNFDTSPNYSGNGFNGSWGAFPFLPSGLILASDIEEGLYILDANYIRGAFLEGMVTDQSSGNSVFDVKVEILGTSLVTQTVFDGTYEFGTTISGTFDVKFTKSGYVDLIVQNVPLVNGEIELLDVELETMLVGLDELDGEATKMHLFPNPFTSSVTIEYDIAEASNSYTLSIYNTMGSEIESRVIKSSQGMLVIGDRLLPGVYIVRLTADDQLIKQSKLIKQ
jgi:choice-of-anchor B domain-containing protein